MTARTKTYLWSAFGCYAAVRAYQYFQNPSPDLPRITPFIMVTTAAMAFYAAFKSYRNKSSPAKRLTRSERVGIKIYGVFLISIGLTFLVVACWLLREQWISVTRWPRVNAILISKNISRGGARMVFRYEVSSCVV